MSSGGGVLVLLPMAHLAARQQITYTAASTGGPMAKPNPADDGKTQRQKFIEAARELGADSDTDTFRRAVRKVATAPVSKPKKNIKKA